MTTFLEDLERMIGDEKSKSAALRALKAREKALDEARAKARTELRPKLNTRLRAIEMLLERCASEINTMKGDLGFEAKVRGLDSDQEKALFVDLCHHHRTMDTLKLSVTPAGVATFDPPYTNPFQLLEAPDTIYEATLAKFVASSYHDACS